MVKDEFELKDINSLKAHLNQKDFYNVYNENYKRNIEKMILKQIQQQRELSKFEMDELTKSPTFKNKEYKTVLQEYFNTRELGQNLSHNQLNEWIKGSNDKQTLLFM